ncbi:hypothetical protein CEP52_013865 [Fusarium oligoseptatum]|uniref:Siderophore iron transporter 1 n=1 Tax=Fusarium oligoseptatum TaxID=2604345 RepID=A0A428SRF3_9HYPO|nr:hypothetical protein CEP52_013865 [Fusarium oligoseptatum]
MATSPSDEGVKPDSDQKVNTSATATDDNSEPQEEKLPGVTHMEAFNDQITTIERYILFSSMVMVGFAFGLDALVRSTYQGYATSSYSQHSLLSTINVIRGVIAAAVQPLVAKLSDLVGRLRLFLIITLFYVVGTIVETCSTQVQHFAAGALLYQIGYTCTLLVLEIIIADITSIRSRVMFVLLPNVPYIINTWISGNVTSAVLAVTTWKWGIGMWCIIYPVCCIPFVTVMAIVGRRASKALPHETKYSPSNGSIRLRIIDLFQKLDIVGVLFLTATLSLTLIPLTLAGGESKKWQTAGIITPIVLGILMIPVFVFWEKHTPHPMIPKYLLRERGVWAAFCLAICMSFSWCTQSDFLYTVLIVGFDFNIADSTRIASVYAFCAIVGGLSIGLLIKKIRRLKPFIIGGICFWLVAYGLLFHYRGGTDSSAKAGVIAGQVLLGLAGGSFSYPNMAAAQALTRHEDIAVITSIMLTMNNVGVALGNAVSGAIWTQTLYDRLQRDLAPNSQLAQQVYAAPLYVVPEYPVGTPERTAIIESYRYIQRLLTIAGMCLVIPMLAFALCLRNTRLPKPKSLSNS